MYNYQAEIDVAKYFLSHHMPGKALKRMARAIDDCPTCHGKDFALLLFYLGIIVKKLGHPNSAIKFWISSYRVKKNKYAKEMIKRFSNGYGFKKEETEELDDKKAYYSIHLLRYLAKKKTRQFSTPAELDMITDLLEERWDKIVKSSILNNKSIEEKQKIFKQIKIVFPLLVFNQATIDSLLKPNFSAAAESGYIRRCICGSGLPYHMCCARTPSVEELANGFF